jgi:peptide-methionine (S)-S-oxide reductase
MNLNKHITTLKTTIFMIVLTLLYGTTLGSCVYNDKSNNNQLMNVNNIEEELNENAGQAVAIFGTGCFWCTEALFETLEGIQDVVSGYSGGKTKNPDYRSVCSGTTGHAECVKITYDPTVISYKQLLEAFFRSHDPTSLNRQGADVGTQYRSVIFYTNPKQKQEAEEIMTALNNSGAYPKPIVTEISALDKFYIAEKYHQDYYANNPGEGYCAVVIAPKLEKFKEVFKNNLKQ